MVPRKWCNGDTPTLRKVTLQYLRCGRHTFRELFAVIINDFGQLNERRLWRALKFLVDANKVIHLGVRRSSESYWTAFTKHKRRR